MARDTSSNQLPRAFKLGDVVDATGVSPVVNNPWALISSFNPDTGNGVIEWADAGAICTRSFGPDDVGQIMLVMSAEDKEQRYNVPIEEDIMRGH